MQESRARAGDHRLFEFLAASKPERERRTAVAAVAASVGGHALVIGVVVWATLAAAQRVWMAPNLSGHDDFVLLLSPGQLNEITSGHSAAPALDAPAKHARYVLAAPSADRVRAFIKVLPLMAPDPAVDIEPVAHQADVVFASLEESEFGGIDEDSASTRVAAILDHHHEPTSEQLAQEGPYIGSFTQAPELTNPEQMQRMLSRDYPENLKQGGVGGRVLLWFLVDEYGHVRRWLLKASSGHAALDKIAMKDAAFVRFKPAWNYDRHVALWIVLPITFMVDEG